MSQDLLLKSMASMTSALKSMDHSMYGEPSLKFSTI